MGHFEGDWKSVPELVQWRKEIDAWSSSFGIFGYVRAVGNGDDPTKSLHLIDPGLIWTEQDGNGPDLILPEFRIGDWGTGGVQGWFIAKISRPAGFNQEFESMKELTCPVCEDGDVSEPDDCGNCDGEGLIWLRLSETGFIVDEISDPNLLQKTETFESSHLGKIEVDVRTIYQMDEEPGLANALSLYENKDWINSASQLKPFAEKGNILALFKYANCLSNLGQKQIAAEMWAIGAAAKHPASCNNLANVYRNAGNLELAKDLYLIAAEAGEPDAMFNLALIYEQLNDSQAGHWMNQAYEAGVGRACANLALKAIAVGQSELGRSIAEEGLKRGDFVSGTIAALEYTKSSNWQKALEVLRETVMFSSQGTNDQVFNAFRLVAVSQMQLGQFFEARDTLKVCDQLRPSGSEDLWTIVQTNTKSVVGSILDSIKNDNK